MFTHELDWAGLALFDRAGTLNPALGNVDVRRAIAHAIDREAILSGAGNGYGTVTGQIFNINSTAYDESLDDAYPYDPDQARQLLTDAGFGDGFTLELPQIPLGSTAVYDLLKQYLEDVGITVEYVPTPIQNAFTDLLAAKYAAAYVILQQDPTAWQTANFAIAPAAPVNVFRVQDPQIDASLQTIQRGSEEESADAALQLNTYVVDQAWFVPFYRVQSAFAGNDSIEVEHQSDNAYPYLWNITPKA